MAVKFDQARNGGGSVGQIDQLDSGLRVQSTFNADANDCLLYTSPSPRD